MTIELKPDHRRVIERVIQSGAYRDPGEVISAALEMPAEEIKSRDGQLRQRGLWELRIGLSLGDTSIRELIEEERQ